MFLHWANICMDSEQESKPMETSLGIVLPRFSGDSAWETYTYTT
jgi:hypothetical protein